MADSAAVTPNIGIVANNIQSKVGSTLLGAKAMVQEDTKGPSAILNTLVDLQQQTVEQLTEIWEILRSQLDFEKDEARRARQEAKELALEMKRDRAGAGGAGGGKRGKGGLAGQVEDGGGFDFGDIVTFGIAGLAGALGAMVTGFVGRMARLIFSRITMAITGVVWAILDGFKGKEAWGDIYGEVPAFIGGMLGGADKGMKNAFKGALKWVGPFALAGSVIPVIGTWFGAMLGLLVGGLMGYIGGEKIAEAVSKLGDMTLEDLWGSLRNSYKNLKLKLDVAMEGPLITAIVEDAKKIFAPIEWAFKKIINGLKHAINAVIYSINLLLPKENEIGYLDIEPIGEKAIAAAKAKEKTAEAKQLALKSEDKESIVSPEMVADVLEAADIRIAQMKTDEFKEEGMSKKDLEQIRIQARAMLKLANSGKISKENATLLQLKAEEIINRMTEAAKEIEYTNIEEGDKVPKHIEELVKKDSERATDTTAADEEKQILADFDKKEKERIAKIEHINELKKQEEYTNSRGLNAQLIQQNKELEKQKEKIDDYEAGKITALDLETDKVTIEAEKIEIEEEVKKSIKFDRSKMRKGAKKFLKDKEETTPSVTKVDGSPTIMSTKNISQLQTSSVFPVDHSLMASLNGYTKTG
jgi:hypothetical protein